MYLISDDRRNDEHVLYRCVGSVHVSSMLYSYRYTALCSCLDMDVVPRDDLCMTSACMFWNIFDEAES